MDRQKRPGHCVLVFSEKEVKHQQADDHQWIDAEEPLHAIAEQGTLFRVSGGIADDESADDEKEVNAKGTILKKQITQFLVGIDIIQVVSEMEKHDKQGRKAAQILDAFDSLIIFHRPSNTAVVHICVKGNMRKP